MRLERLLRQRGQVLAWQVGTGAGPVLVKRFWAGPELPWRDQLSSALEFEEQAVRAGIETPAPLRPVRPYFATVARVDGMGLVRAFPYLEHREFGETDDVAGWVGATLARTHRIRTLDAVPEPNYWYGQGPPVAREQWRAWLRRGERDDRVWAPALAERLDLVTAWADRVVATFRTTGPHVISHRDVEPWNVLITETGPVLIDWDASGPESAPLETGYVLATFAGRGDADPDPELVRRGHAGYVAAGGSPLTHRPGLLDRLIGVELARIAGDLGEFFDSPIDDHRTRDRLDQLPDLIDRVRRWESIFTDL